MAKLKPGDRIDCRVKSAVIVSPYSSYDEVKTFEIVAADNQGYYIYVPYYYSLNATTIADKHKCKSLKINEKFLGEKISYVKENLVFDVRSKMDGMCCAICKEFYQYASANQEDGSLICFPCRANPYRGA